MGGGGNIEIALIGRAEFLAGAMTFDLDGNAGFACVEDGFASRCVAQYACAAIDGHGFGCGCERQRAQHRQYGDFAKIRHA